MRDFGLRIPALAIDGIIELARPTIENPNLVGAETIAELLVNAYCAVPSRRAHLAEVLGARMARQEATPELWDVVQQIPEDARSEIEAHVVSAATAGLRDAIACAAAWGLDTLPNQIGARRVAAQPVAAPAQHQRWTSGLESQRGSHRVTCCWGCCRSMERTSSNSTRASSPRSGAGLQLA